MSKPLPPASPPSARSDSASGASATKGTSKQVVSLSDIVEVLPPELSFGKRGICFATLRTVDLVHVGTVFRGLPAFHVLVWYWFAIVFLILQHTGHPEEVIEHWIDADNDGMFLHPRLFVGLFGGFSLIPWLGSALLRFHVNTSMGWSCIRGCNGRCTPCFPMNLRLLAPST
jgi:hypothetical protein